MIMDHCTLMECVNDCVGIEHAYDWFDYFIRHQTPWKIHNSGNNTSKSKNSKIQKQHTDTATITTIENPSLLIKGNKRTRDDNSNEENMMVVNATGDIETKGVDDADKDDIQLSESVDHLSEEEFIQMKCRFANAMADLQLAGLIKMKSPLSIEIINHFKKKALVQDNTTTETSALTEVTSSRRNLGVTRQSFSWIASIHE